jgi:hypothetical protein
VIVVDASSSLAGVLIKRHRRKLMLKALVRSCALAGFLILLPFSVAAQQVVHALTGTVSSINKASETIAVLQDIGGDGVFQNPASPKTRVSLDKKIEPGTVAADAFKENGAYVIVFYYGGTDNRTVVAFKNLGTGPFSSTAGIVKKYERAHAVTVQDQSGAVQTFRIAPDTVAEGYAGAVDGTKFQASGGDKVRIVSAVVDGSPTVLFIRLM